jgi:hypothetical protein
LFFSIYENISIIIGKLIFIPRIECIAASVKHQQKQSKTLSLCFPENMVDFIQANICIFIHFF